MAAVIQNVYNDGPSVYVTVKSFGEGEKDYKIADSGYEVLAFTKESVWLLAINNPKQSVYTWNTKSLKSSDSETQEPKITKFYRHNYEAAVEKQRKKEYSGIQRIGGGIACAIIPLAGTIVWISNGDAPILWVLITIFAFYVGYKFPKLGTIVFAAGAGASAVMSGSKPNSSNRGTSGPKIGCVKYSDGKATVYDMNGKIISQTNHQECFHLAGYTADNYTMMYTSRTGNDDIRVFDAKGNQISGSRSLYL